MIHYDDASCKKWIFFALHMVSNLTMEWPPHVVCICLRENPTHPIIGCIWEGEGKGWENISKKAFANWMTNLLLWLALKKTFVSLSSTTLETILCISNHFSTQPPRYNPLCRLNSEFEAQMWMLCNIEFIKTWNLHNSLKLEICNLHTHNCACWGHTWPCIQLGGL